jgi:ABC-type molybdenum transport system ATPase subunit/photorepair protein PhrA
LTTVAARKSRHSKEQLPVVVVLSNASDHTMSESKILLNVNGIEVIYNHVILVLKGVSLTVPEGGIVALLGGNGAGKTTTLRAANAVR